MIKYYIYIIILYIIYIYIALLQCMLILISTIALVGYNASATFWSRSWRLIDSFQQTWSRHHITVAPMEVSSMCLDG